MARNLDHRLWEAWQRRIGQQKRSGLSIVAFCRKEGISPGSFNFTFAANNDYSHDIRCPHSPFWHVRTPSVTGPRP